MRSFAVGWGTIPEMKPPPVMTALRQASGAGGEDFLPGVWAQAVVEPAGAPLPELDRVRNHTVATPVGRANDIVAAGVFLLKLRHALLKRGAALDHRALR